MTTKKESMFRHPAGTGLHRGNVVNLEQIQQENSAEKLARYKSLGLHPKQIQMLMELDESKNSESGELGKVSKFPGLELGE